MLDQHYEQLSRGCFAGSLSSITHERVTLFRETLGQSVFQTGCAAADQITIATACDLSGEAYWNGGHIESDAVIAFVPGREFALRTPVRSVCVGISISTARLAAGDLNQTADDWERLLRPKDCWSDPHPSESRLSQRIARLFGTLSDPSALCSGSFDQELDDVLDDLRAVVGMRVELGHRLRADSYPRISRKARAAMLDQLEEPLQINALCTRLGCSPRALQYAFQSVFDINPVAYFRSLRLTAARRALLGPHRTMTVQDVAAQFGFGHLPLRAGVHADVRRTVRSTNMSKSSAAPPSSRAIALGSTSTPVPGSVATTRPRTPRFSLRHRLRIWWPTPGVSSSSDISRRARKFGG